jgi:hypothetical protein
MQSPTSPKKAFCLAGLVVALVSFLPFVRLLLGGQSFYFRDLSGQFFPARMFLLEGLQRGEWRLWNPLVHEGVPVALSPFGYLPDLLQRLIPTEFGISLLLALHVPLAGVAFMLLARDLELPPPAALTGALVYALGGFTLSTINLYVYVQTMAWAPLFVLAFRRAVETGSRRALALAAMALATTVSTTGLEIALQACLLATVIAPPTSVLRFLRSAAVTILAIGLSAAVILPLLKLAADSERGSGFATSVVLANSVHPLNFAQVAVAGFFGDPSNLTGAWWGVNFFPRGFPYMLSLYLGPAVIALAAAGALVNRPLRLRLVLLALGAVVLCLGRYAGWEWFFDLSPALRSLRYPVKAFYTVQFCLALLSSFAVAGILEGTGAHLRRATGFGFGIGGMLVGTLLLPSLAPESVAWFMNGFLPPSVPETQRALIARFIAGDAATGGALAVAIGVLSFLALRGRLRPAPVAWAVAGLVGADLLRAGAGLNPSVTADFYRLSPEMAAQAALIKAAGGRAFTCDVQSSPSYWQGRRARAGHHEAFTMAAFQETLTPDFNVPYGVRTALSIDRTMLVPTDRVLSPELAACRDLEAIVASLRARGVTRVISLEPLDHAALSLLAVVAPERITPLRVHIYDLSEARARFSEPVKVIEDIPNRLVLEAAPAAPVRLTVREPFARGWRTTLDGVETRVTRTEDGHRELPLSAGSHRIEMRYEAEGLRMGIGISLLAVAICAGLLFVRPPA